MPEAEAKKFLDELVSIKSIDEAISKLNIKITVPQNSLSTVDSFKRLSKIYDTLKNMKGSNKFNPNKAKLIAKNKKVPLSKNGISADFANTPYLYKTKVNEKNIVKIKLTGSRYLDDKLAYELAGIKPSDDLLKNFVWHHMNDFDPVSGTCIMQLVEREVHRYCKPHYGSTSLVDYFFQKPIYSNKVTLKL